MGELVACRQRKVTGVDTSAEGQVAPSTSRNSGSFESAQNPATTAKADLADSQGKKVGTFGDLATVSFYPAHHMTMGEGGCVMTEKPLLRTLAVVFQPISGSTGEGSESR